MTIEENLIKHLNKEKISFHMPGHKGRNVFLNKENDYDFWQYDTTELSDTDCLQNPQDFLKKAEDKCAKIYGADHSFFLVNGSTSGILAMFFACFKEGDKVVISRDCHKSVINAMIFSGVNPIYVSPLINEYGLPGGANTAEIEEAFKKNPDCKGVFITSPSYYGIISDISEVSKIAHKYGALVLCDEAHGAHFPFSKKFPESAIKQGADISVVSLHKTLPAPNQTAVLNLGNCSINRDRMQNAVNMFQTTSPSYVLMCAMEKALDLGAKKGKELTDKIIKLIPDCKYIKSFDDPFKIILDFTEKGFSGFYAAKIMEQKFGIYCEMVQHNYILLMVSWGNDENDFSCLLQAINYIDSLPCGNYKKENYDIELLKNDNICNSPRDVAMKDTQNIKLDFAIGRIAAQEVTPFPPCIPIFMPGEKIKKEHIEYIKKLQKEEASIFGIENNCLLVVKED